MSIFYKEYSLSKDSYEWHVTSFYSPNSLPSDGLWCDIGLTDVDCTFRKLLVVFLGLDSARTDTRLFQAQPLSNRSTIVLIIRFACLEIKLLRGAAHFRAITMIQTVWYFVIRNSSSLRPESESTKLKDSYPSGLQ